MLGNLFNNIIKEIDDYYKKVTSFFSIIFYILFLCFFHNAYFSIILIIPAILLMTERFKNNKYIKESDLLVVVFSITMAFIMKFIILYFGNLNVISGIGISLIVTALIGISITILSFLFALIFKPFFKYFKID